jgi:hypothetical protein
MHENLQRQEHAAGPRPSLAARSAVRLRPPDLHHVKIPRRSLGPEALRPPRAPVSELDPRRQ